MTTEPNNDQFDRALHDLLDPSAEGPAAPLDDLAEQRMVRDIVEAAERGRPPAPATTAGGRPRWRWGLVGVAAAAAAVLLVVAQPQMRATERQADGATLVSASHVTVDMAASYDGQTLPEGSQLIVGGEGSAALDLGGGISAWLDADSRATLERLGDDRRVLALEYGRVVSSVEPQRPGASFQILTSLGTVEVVGTMFSVTAREGRVGVKVHRGEVRVHETNRGEHQLVAGESLVLPGGERRPLDLDDLVADASLAGERVPEAADIDAAPTAPAADPAPPTVADAPAPAKADAPAKAATPSKAPQPSLADLMREVSEHRANRRWRDAARTYGTIREAFPRSKQACTVLVPRAQLLLDHLADARGALADLDAYGDACGAGPLTEEADWHRTRALRALRKTAQERGALERFLAAHPGSLNRAAARLRLADIQRAGGDCTHAAATYRELLAAKPGAKIAREAQAGLDACGG